MKLAIKFALVVCIGFIGACFHKIKRNRRELPDDHFV